MISNLAKSSGTLVYHQNWVVVELSRDFGNYYYSLIPKYKKKQPQKHKCHVTIVRKGIETPTTMENWGIYDGQTIPFLYSPIINSGQKYYFLDCYSVFIGLIRNMLGLPHFRQSTYVGFDCYHITIGNKK